MDGYQATRSVQDVSRHLLRVTTDLTYLHNLGPLPIEIAPCGLARSLMADGFINE